MSIQTRLKIGLVKLRVVSFYLLLYLLLKLVTTWTLTKCMGEKLDSNYMRMLWAVLNKSWKQHYSKQQLYGHLLTITKTIKVRRTRHVRPCWRSKDELVSDVLQWTLSHGLTKVGRPARTYLQQLCANTGCSLGDLPGPIDDRDGWRERVRDIRVDGVTWWWVSFWR